MSHEVSGWWRGTAARTAYVVVGVMFGAVISLTSPQRGSPAWAVWASVAIALAAAGGVVFGYGLARWPEIAALGGVRRARVAAFVVQIIAVAVAGLVLGAMLPGATATIRGVLLALVSELAAIPVVATLAGIRELAPAVSGTAGEQFERLLTLRRMLSGLVNAVGVLVALVTLAIGAALPLVTGSAPALVVVSEQPGACLWLLPTCRQRGAVRDSARSLCRTIVPLAGTAWRSPISQPGSRPADGWRRPSASTVAFSLISNPGSSSSRRCWPAPPPCSCLATGTGRPRRRRRPRPGTPGHPAPPAADGARTAHPPRRADHPAAALRPPPAGPGPGPATPVADLDLTHPAPPARTIHGDSEPGATGIPASPPAQHHTTHRPSAIHVGHAPSYPWFRV